MLDEEQIMGALKQVYDPEIPVDIVNLGLIYGVGIDGGKVVVQMTTTAPGCPVGSFIAAEAERVIRNLDGVSEVHVELVFEPPWTMDKMSAEGKKLLGWP